MSTGGIAPGNTSGIPPHSLSSYEEIIEGMMDDLDKLSREVRPEQYVHVSRAADAIRELAAELGVDV